MLLRQASQCRPRAEELLAFAGQQNHVNTFVHASFQNGFVELLHHVIGVSVCRGIGERNNRYTIEGFVIYEAQSWAGYRRLVRRRKRGVSRPKSQKDQREFIAEEPWRRRDKSPHP